MSTYHVGTIGRIICGLCLAFALVACSDHDAALVADYDALCNAMARSGADAIKDPSDRIEKLADYLKANLKTREVKDLFASLAGAPADGPARIRKAATRAGYSGACPTADER